MLPTLDARLAAAAELVRPGQPVADIGCDHGKLTAVLAASGRYPKVIGADLRPGPLSKARQTLEHANCQDRAELRLGDGLSVLSAGEVGSIVLAGVSAICMHTNLDAAAGGVNEVLAGIFGMQDPEPFAGGCGRVGSIEPITVPQLARKAQQELAARCNAPDAGPAVQVKFADTGKPVQRLAVISGAGGSLFEEALAVGADCLLTGEANHHHACDAKRLGLSLIAAGHYATEFPVTAAVAEKLRAALPGVEVLVSTANKDPYTYL